ncbi:MAG: hypothetical protein KGH57_03180 [Candidatus Micrarchaeota archaeon]|nr:hypothetical protein [Candidatus Micrarchaeota archaeon]
MKKGLAKAFSIDEVKKHRNLYTLILAAGSADLVVSLVDPTTYLLLQLPTLKSVISDQELGMLNAFFNMPYISGPVIYGGGVASEYVMWTVGIKAMEKGYRLAKSIYPHAREAFEKDTRLYPALNAEYRKALGIVARDTVLYPAIKGRMNDFSEIKQRRTQLREH